MHKNYYKKIITPEHSNFAILNMKLRSSKITKLRKIIPSCAKIENLHRTKFKMTRRIFFLPIHWQTFLTFGPKKDKNQYNPLV